MTVEAVLPPPSEELTLEESVRQLGLRLAERSAHNRWSGLVEGRLLGLADDPELQVPLMRLVDVAPACDSPKELGDHLGALMLDATPQGAIARFLRRAATTPALRGLSGRVALRVVRRLARRFIVGETAGESVPVLAHLWHAGGAASVDLLGEKTATRAEAQAYADRCDETLRTLAAAVESWPERPMLERDSVGELSRVNLSVKITALTPLVRGDAPERGRADAAEHLRRLLRTARELGAHVHVDMEWFDAHELVLGLALKTFAEPEFAEGPSSGIVIQGYLRDSEEELERVLEWARDNPRAIPLTIRLVKGAYWDHETIEAHQHGWMPPVWTQKTESDRCFERLTRRLIDAFPLVRPAIASHNLRSVAHAVAYARQVGLAAGDLEVQVLRGLGDDLQRALAAEGLRGRVYCPVGDLVAGMAYLVRRLLENTSNDSFLARRASGVNLDRLLACP